MNDATCLRQQAAAYRARRASEIRIGYMLLSLEWMAYDAAGGVSDYALGPSKAQAAEELETQLRERDLC